MFHLNHVVCGNSVIVWLVTAGVALGLPLVLYAARIGLHRTLAGRDRWKDSLFDRYLLALLAHIHPLFLAAAALSRAALIPALPARASRLFSLLGPLAMLFQIACWGHISVAFWLEAPLKEVARTQDRAAATRAAVVGFILRLVLGSLVLLMTLSLLGFNITTLLASLGIGGIGIALAVQNILGDLFASLSIAFDKPFIVGDFIVVDDYLGAVEYVGLKTTRLRSLSGEQIIFSNADLLKSRIRNFKRMVERRALFTFTLPFETSQEHLEALPAVLKAIIAAQAKTRFDRAHLKAFTDSGLQFEVVYYLLDPDPTFQMDVQQAINLDLLRHFRTASITFAIPRRMIHTT